jgi:hypothetical protein
MVAGFFIILKIGIFCVYNMSRRVGKEKKILFTSEIRIQKINHLLEYAGLISLVPQQAVTILDTNQIYYSFRFPPCRMPEELQKALLSLSFYYSVKVHYDADGRLYRLHASESNMTFDFTTDWNSVDNEKAAPYCSSTSLVKSEKVGSPVVPFKLTLHFPDGDYQVNATEKQAEVLLSIIKAMDSKESTLITRQLLERLTI